MRHSIDLIARPKTKALTKRFKKLNLKENAISFKSIKSKSMLNLGDWTWCLHQMDSKRKNCEKNNEIPNPIEDPNEDWKSFLKWSITPKESGEFTLCWKDVMDTFLSCVNESSHSIGCVNNYTDSDGRKHIFPCSSKCTFTTEETAEINGCDSSKGIVTQGCDVFKQDWCKCPSGSIYNKLSKKCICENPSHVTYYGKRKYNNSFDRGYCAPQCPNGFIYDIDPLVNSCIRKPKWY